MIKTKKTSKMLVICGPTSLGKTSLGLSLAKKIDGEIVSADSRQVYKGMDIGTGKDLPRGAKIENGYYIVSGVRIWGYDLVKPTQKFSVATYYKKIKKILEDIEKRGKIPIVVGGTGLYIKSIIDEIETISIPIDPKIRKYLKNEKEENLFERLAVLDPVKAASLNSSDKKNPRRLIRAIEVAEWKIKNEKKAIKNKEKIKKEVLIIGLKAPRLRLSKLIRKRVTKRLSMGIEKEVKKLREQKVSWHSQAMSSLGYAVWRPFFEGKVKKDKVIASWVKEETKYAREQMVWFKKDKRINWFDATKKESEIKIEKLVKEWHNRS